MEENEIMRNLKYKKTFYCWPEGPDSDFARRNEEVKITIEQSFPFYDEDLTEIKETLEIMFDVYSVKTIEDLMKEKEQLDKYIKDYQKRTRKW